MTLDEADELPDLQAEFQPDGQVDLSADLQPGMAPNLGAILDIPLTVQVVLGGTTMPVANLMKLGRGAVIPLDHRVGQPVDIVVNGRVIARGDVTVIEGENDRLGVSLTEIVGRSVRH